MTTTASSVSAALRRCGFQPSNDRRREGIRVTGSVRSGIRVAADLDSDAEARRLSNDTQEALVELGYAVHRADTTSIYVTNGV